MPHGHIWPEASVTRWAWLGGVVGRRKTMRTRRGGTDSCKSADLTLIRSRRTSPGRSRCSPALCRQLTIRRRRLRKLLRTSSDTQGTRGPPCMRPDPNHSSSPARCTARTRQSFVMSTKANRMPERRYSQQAEQRLWRAARDGANAWGRGRRRNNDDSRNPLILCP
jgi:hypothetical protein